MTSIRGFLFICGILLVQLLKAQNPLIVQGATPQLYLVHTVVAKENWYSVGRIYNQSPKDIAPFNGTSLEKPLAIGQHLKIPLNAMNLSQDGSKAADEVLVPLHHVVADKEWMYRISIGHNKVPIANLEKWNGLTNDQLKAGMKVIVGYLKVKTGQSPLVAMATNKPVTGEPVAKNDPPQQPAKDPVKEPAKEPEVISNPPVTRPPDPVKTEPTPVKEPVREEPKPAGPATTEPAPSNNTPANFKGGYFRSSYSNSGKGTAGNAAIFRSNSGWKDGKYYALMNNVPVGTIVKVSFSSTNKTVYAKVLGQLPEMKENVGLNLRLSDAAASELGATNGKFYVNAEW
ncbi:LysM peptidoglycan-binding domain-containing protein [Pseudoflavitalea sp. G-6-1-2]|uniref:LysM peptidoglycan-binding domain-containing protein n=1 Tax=Pseudoflavitalea sp. G-6-1-2 TaxID=2728841 RepID=UPI00146C524C|nr:LysM peptidoglycan-binding domain-containing protein [Pseudoflavitalea sp. G-6-1-2]NML23153.1 LysM peptidoglycan-binding domain-containing protein [Pseudoflavitalea sp. G-6-1-2]